MKRFLEPLARLGQPYQALVRLLSALRPEKWTATALGTAFLAVLAIILVSTQFGDLFSRFRPTDFNTGAVAEKDLVADRDFTYVDERATQLKRDASLKLVPPVFRFREEVPVQALARFDGFAASLRTMVAQGLSPDRIYLTVQADHPDAFQRKDILSLLSQTDLSGTLDAARATLAELMDLGIIELSADSMEAVSGGFIELWRWKDGKLVREEIPVLRVLSRGTLAEKATTLAQERARSAREADLIGLLAAGFAAENAFLDLESTRAHRDRAREQVEPVTEKLAKGQILVRKGDLITESAAAKIKALSEYAITVNINGILSTVFFLVIVLVVALYLFDTRTLGTALRRNQMVFLLALGVAYVLLGGFLARLDMPGGAIPVAVLLPTSTFSILIALLIAPNAGLLFSLVVALLLLPLTRMNISSFLFAFLSGLAGSVVVLKTERRVDLIRAGEILAVVDLPILWVVCFISNASPPPLVPTIGWSLVNGFSCGVLSLGFLPLFESMLNAPTRFKLMELSDLNAPLFKRMLSLAPGTYTHSISVANLAESAAEAIGANAMLARVSAYYHDLGKIDQAEYFIENQKAFNKHDEMKPSLSVAVIKSHVRIGVEKARELKLPTAIIDLIAQHHGRDLIKFFYHRAVQEGKSAKVSREEFSYPGTRPRTREAAVLMLADSVEAASRTLKRPDTEKLDKFVWSIIMDKFNAGELSECSLPIRDLETIRKSFVRVLEGTFHTRIEYPKLKEPRMAKDAAV
jgi:cyclic-di-AMP phosphodiesterase PgpH